MIKHHHQTPAPPARVVILGASGFVGKSLLGQLQGRGIDTVPLTSAQVDLCQPTSVQKLKDIIRPQDVVVFASALTPDKGKDQRALMRNLTMSQHVAEVLEQTPCSQVVYLSSDAVYEDSVNPVREDSRCDAGSLYGLMHVVREKMLASVAPKSGCALLILRCCAVYGAGDTHNSYGPNRFLRTALRDSKITLFGKGEEKRDHVYVDDLTRLLVLGIEQRSEGVLNIASGQSLSFFELATMIAQLVNQDVRIECLPRATPITHRHFDVTATLRAYPTFCFTSLSAGLGASWAELSRTHKDGAARKVA